MKFRCERQIECAEGYQEFEVEAESEEDAIKMFKADKGELVHSECEVVSLSGYDLSSIRDSTGEE